MSQLGNDNQLAKLKQSMFIEDSTTGGKTQVRVIWSLISSYYRTAHTCSVCMCVHICVCVIAHVEPHKLILVQV